MLTADAAGSDGLWYRQPADTFLEALPLGNGRMGAMVYGGVREECIELNADTLWSGGPGPRDRYRAAMHLPALRDAVLRGRDYAYADQAARRMLSADTEAYQPLAALRLDFGDAGAATHYRRTLNLDQAIHRTAFSIGDARIEREAFVSVPAEVMVLRITTSIAGTLSFACEHRAPSGIGPVRCDALAAMLPKRAWQRMSAGRGAKGERYYDRAVTDLAVHRPGTHQVLIRRNRRTGEPAFYRCFAPGAVPLRTLVRVAGRRGAVEQTFQAAKGPTGPDQPGYAAGPPGTAGPPWPCSPTRSSQSCAHSNAHTTTSEP